ncbi:MAG: glycosyltransferase [Deltaproteobacteria bacterium]|nr:glycosyltransferase [Deltaproteobacteria bacterium]
MRVLAVVQGRGLASSRIRIQEMIPHLRWAGVACDAVPYPRSLPGLWSLTTRAEGFDLVWLQKKMPSAGDRLLWKRVAAPIVFDFDDAIGFRKEPRRGSYYSWTRARRFRQVLRLARAATCGNRYLASLVPRDRPIPTLIYPSPVPVAVPRRDYGAASGPVRLGWIGGGGNLDSLRAVAPAVARVCGARGATLRVISDRPFAFQGLAVENVLWSLESQAAELAELDLGLMPLDGDSPFDRGKCSYKLLQYMAAGIAAVGSAVGMNAEVIEDGRNGRLVHRAEDWERVLDELLRAGRPELAALGAAGRRSVEAEFSYEGACERLVPFFRRARAEAR